MGATAMKTAMKASDGNEGDGGGDNGGGRAMVMRVEGSRQWQGRQEQLLWQKAGDGLEEGDGEGSKSNGDGDKGGG
jgi:hypothetical protein